MIKLTKDPVGGYANHVYLRTFTKGVWVCEDVVAKLFNLPVSPPPKTIWLELTDVKPDDGKFCTLTAANVPYRGGFPECKVEGDVTGLDVSFHDTLIRSGIESHPIYASIYYEVFE